MGTLKEKIQQALIEFWDARALPSGPDGATVVDDLVSPIESLTAVDVLATLDPIVGMKLPNSVIQAGGYKTKEEFVEKLSGKVLRIVEKSE